MLFGKFISSLAFISFYTIYPRIFVKIRSSRLLDDDDDDDDDDIDDDGGDDDDDDDNFPAVSNGRFAHSDTFIPRKQKRL